MLRIIKGAFNSERDRLFCEAVREAESQGKNVLVIMPDQYSFECDKKLYKALGAKAFNRISTAGFNRLAGLISRKYGKCAYENADENKRLIVMFKAVSRFKSDNDSRYYARSLSKSRFIGEMIDLVGGLMRSGITPEDLRIASEKLEGSVSLKLYDISRIFSYYLEELQAKGLRDSLTALSDALTLVTDYGYFNGMSVFLDGFTDFTCDELNYIDTMLSQHADVTVSVICRSRGRGVNLDHPFAAAIRTCSRLTELAKVHSTEVEITEPEEITGAGETVLAIDRYYCTGKTSDKEHAGGLTVAAANDLYDELDYVCAQIEHLVAEKGYSYSEIAVAARELSSVADAAEASFERYGIPAFSDRSLRADSSLLVIFLKNIFECVVPKKYHTDDIMRLVRSPLFPLNDIEVTNLEDHCITFGINGDMWLEPFCAHDSVHDVPSNLEDIRQKIILPLEAFRSACEDAAASAIAEALYRLLEAFETSKQLYSVIRRSEESGSEAQLEFARSCRQLWQSVFGAVKTIHDELADEPIRLKRFYELFKLMTSRMTVSSPPQKLEAVRLVNAESSRLDNVRALFVIDVNERIFPAEPRSEGLFTEAEKQKLAGEKLAVSGTALQSAENERLVVYRTLCLPKELLYVIYTESDTAGKSRRKSVIIDKLRGIFGETAFVQVSKLPITFFCTSYRTAYFKYLEHSKEKLVAVEKNRISSDDLSAHIKSRLANADRLASVEQALSGSDEYSSKLAALPSYAYDQSFSVTRKTAKELFYPDKLSLSHTRINTFYTCPFSYYCKYGLKLRAPQKMKLDSAAKGNYLHRCLESLMSSEDNGKKIYNKQFVFYTDEQLKERIAASFNAYESEEFGGSYGKSASFFAERDRYEKTVLEIVKLVQDEFSRSQFVPAFFEYKLEHENGESSLELKLSDELTVKVVGSIDRADIFTAEDGKKYLRIVDYKTGKTVFDLEMLYHGLNLQMLIYLLAMTNEYPDLIPAAVMYSHTREGDCKLEPPMPKESPDTYGQRLKGYKPEGFISDDPAVIKAFNRSHKGAFMPVSLTVKGEIYKSGRQPVTEDFLRSAEEYARRKMLVLADRISSGLIPAEPVMTESYNPCTRCEHYDICGRVLHGDPELITKEDRAKLIDEVNKITAERKKKGAGTDAKME